MIPILLLVLAVRDAQQAAAPAQRPHTVIHSLADILGRRFVAVGTSITMGTRSGGVVHTGQRTAWPARLAALAGVPFTVPEIESPGCPAPLALPLSRLRTTDGRPTDAAATCAPLRTGVSLPTQDLAIQNALTSDALFTTPESAAAVRPFRGQLYSRVLPSGATQIAALRTSNPTFLAVELGGVEVVRVLAGNAATPLPESRWEPLFDQVMAAVQSTGARAVLVGSWKDASVLPWLRAGRELHAKRRQFAKRYIAVSPACGTTEAANLVDVSDLVALSAEARRARAGGRPKPVFSCSNVPGEIDHVFTPDEIAALNARMGETNAYIAAAARAHGYAFFMLDAVFALSKPEFSVSRLLESDMPYGRYISGDGIHPSARGQEVLAAAAARAILSAYAPVSQRR